MDKPACKCGDPKCVCTTQCKCATGGCPCDRCKK